MSSSANLLKNSFSLAFDILLTDILMGVLLVRSMRPEKGWFLDVLFLDFWCRFSAVCSLMFLQGFLDTFFSFLVSAHYRPYFALRAFEPFCYLSET